MNSSEQNISQFRRGEVVAGRVAHIAPFGLFLELEHSAESGTHGLCEIPRLRRVENGVSPAGVYSGGENLTVRVYAEDRKRRLVAVSEIGVGMPDADSSPHIPVPR